MAQLAETRAAMAGVRQVRDRRLPHRTMPAYAESAFGGRVSQTLGA